MAYWLKSIYNRDKRSEAGDWRSMTWVSDGHRWSKSGNPTFRPSYKVGDELLVYSIWDAVCPARFRVTVEPQFLPKRVSREGFPGDGRRWGWLTEVEYVGSVDLVGAPTLLELDIAPMSVRQQDHIGLRNDQYRLARRAVPDGMSFGERRTARPLPLEERHVESFEQRFERAAKTVVREEQKLVKRYGDYLLGKGRSVCRHRLVSPGGSPSLVTDLFEVERRNLVEAKARTTRPAIRMAIGQLADYSRLMLPKPNRRAVLAPRRLDADLEALLDAENIGLVWRTQSGFADNVGGELT